ncbi:hypothetical protein LguiA_026318 [Lonicera macranthoides]
MDNSQKFIEDIALPKYYRITRFPQLAYFIQEECSIGCVNILGSYIYRRPTKAAKISMIGMTILSQKDS